MKPKESLTELRNKILRIFGESLDEYGKEKEELAKVLNNLGEIKAKMTDEIRQLSDQKTVLLSSVEKLNTEAKRLKTDMASQKKTADESISLMNSQANTRLIQRESELSMKEKVCSDKEVELMAFEKRLIDDDIAIKIEAAHLKDKEKSLEQRIQNNTELSNNLASKEAQIQTQINEIDAKIIQGRRAGEKIMELVRFEADIKRKNSDIEIKEKELASKMDKINISLKEIELKELAFKDREVNLNKREAWIEDRVKTFKSHDV